MAKDKITNSRDAFEIFKSKIGDLPYEEFWIILLNKANKVVRSCNISEGGISGTVVDPRRSSRSPSTITPHPLSSAITIPLATFNPAKPTRKSPKRSGRLGICWTWPFSTISSWEMISTFHSRTKEWSDKKEIRYPASGIRHQLHNDLKLNPNAMK